MMLTKSNEDPSPLFSLPDGRSSRQGRQGFVTLFWQQYPPTMSTPLGASTTALASARPPFKNVPKLLI